MAHARDSFAALAKQLVREGDKERALEVLDAGVERLPFTQLEHSEMSTLPIIEGYYEAGGVEKGDAILRDYATQLVEHIDYYARFDGRFSSMIDPVLDEKLEIYEILYMTAARYGRRELVAEMNDFYRSIGVEEKDLIQLAE